MIVKDDPNHFGHTIVYIWVKIKAKGFEIFPLMSSIECVNLKINLSMIILY